MATTKATGTITSFELFPPRSAENLNKETEKFKVKFAYPLEDEVNLSKLYAVVVADDGSASVLCNAEDYPLYPRLKEGDKVSYMVEGPSAKFGTEITKIS